MSEDGAGRGAGMARVARRRSRRRAGIAVIAACLAAAGGSAYLARVEKAHSRASAAPAPRGRFRNFENLMARRDICTM